MIPRVLIDAMASLYNRSPFQIARDTAARSPRRRIVLTRPTSTPAISTAAPGFSPDAESNSAWISYACPPTTSSLPQLDGQVAETDEAQEHEGSDR